MSGFSLLQNSEIVRVSNAVAAGTGTTNCTGVDCKDYESCMFILAVGTIVATGTVTCHVEQSDDDSTYNDLEGTSVAYVDDAEDNKLLAIEVKNPGDRYLRLVIVRATANTTIDGAVAILSRKDNNVPVTQGSTVTATEFHYAPAEGTI